MQSFSLANARLRLDVPDRSVALTLVAKDVQISLYLGSEQQGLALLRDYADEVRKITPSRTDAVVLPEKVARISQEVLAEVDALFSGAAIATRSAIVLGLVRRTTTSNIYSDRSSRKKRGRGGSYSTNLRALGIANLQRHGFSGLEPRIRARPREPAARPGVGLQS